MAKNNSGTNRKTNTVSDYDQRQANIRKAKGNPNKNVHQKKNGSNYKGYVASKQEAAKPAKRNDGPKMPLWVILTMVFIFIVLVVILVLMNSTMADNLVFGQIATIVIGACCGVLFSLRRYSKTKDSKFQDVLYIVLAVMAVVMIFMGGYGLLRALQM